MLKHVLYTGKADGTLPQAKVVMRAQKYGVVTQMGNQGHSEGSYFNSRLGKGGWNHQRCSDITAHMNNCAVGTVDRISTCREPIPETMDWDTWLGVVQHHDYNHDYHLGQWRCWYDFGMGALGDWGAHILDTAHQLWIWDYLQ